MVLLIVIFLLPLVLLVAGYLELSEGANRKTANGVVLVALAVGLWLWLVQNTS